MDILTEKALLVCRHELGTVDIEPSQDLVTIMGDKVLVDDDPERRPIKRCPNIGATIKPCQHTLQVREGYSDWVRIEGKRVCLDTVTGLTDGTPPNTVTYIVRKPGQDLVNVADS